MLIMLLVHVVFHIIVSKTWICCWYSDYHVVQLWIWTFTEKLNIFTVDLRTIVVADSAIIVDKTGPYTGAVMDGPLHGEDLLYTKYSDRVSEWNLYSFNGVGYVW